MVGRHAYPMLAVAVALTFASSPAHAGPVLTYMPLPSFVSAGTMTIVDGGTKIVFDVQTLWNALQDVRRAADPVKELNSLPRDLRLAAVWEMTHGVEETDSVFRPVPCDERPQDCADEVGGPDEEPPLEASPSAPAPAPSPVCYHKVDVRRQPSMLFRTTLYRFWQDAYFCAEGQIISSSTQTAHYSDIDVAWECQDDNVFPKKDTVTIIPSEVTFQAVGHCFLELGVKDVAISLGATSPSINDTYDPSGKRTIRAGSSR